MRRMTWFNVTSLTFGFAFLYLPMVILIIFSFNESKLVTVWADSAQNGTAKCYATPPFWTRPG